VLKLFVAQLGSDAKVQATKLLSLGVATHNSVGPTALAGVAASNPGSNPAVGDAWATVNGCLWRGPLIFLWVRDEYLYFIRHTEVHTFQVSLH